MTQQERKVNELVKLAEKWANDAEFWRNNFTVACTGKHVCSEVFWQACAIEYKRRIDTAQEKCAFYAAQIVA